MADAMAGAVPVPVVQMKNAGAPVPQTGIPHVAIVEAKVNFDRPAPWKAQAGKSQTSVLCALVFGLFYWAAFIWQLITMILTVANGNVSGKWGDWSIDCNEDDSRMDLRYTGHKNMDDDLKSEYCDCHRRNPGRFLSSDDPTERTMSDLMGDYVHIPITGVLMILAIALGWLVLLKYLGTTFIRISLFLIFAILMTMSISMIYYEAVVGGVVVLIMALALAAYCIIRRKVVKRAGQSMEAASSGLFANLSLFAVLLPLELAFICYVFLWIEVQASYTFHQRVDETCVLVKKATNDFAITLVFIWVSFYVDHCKVNVIAATLAHWAFGQTDGKGGCGLALRAMRWCIFESSPTIACTSMVSSIVEVIKKTISSKLNWCNPLLWIPILIGCCLLHFIKQFGRFVIVVHAITGSHFTECASVSFNLLIKGGNMEQALAANYFAAFSLALFSWVLSVFVGMMMFFWVDHNAGTDIVGWLVDQDITMLIIFWFCVIIFAMMNKWPYFLIWIITLIQPLVENTHLSVMFFWFFCTGVTHLIFKFFASMVLDAVDTMTICYCIDKDNGTIVAETAIPKCNKVVAMYTLLDDMVKENSKDVGKVQPAVAAVAVPPPVVVVATAVSQPINPAQQPAVMIVGSTPGMIHAL